MEALNEYDAARVPRRLHLGAGGEAKRPTGWWRGTRIDPAGARGGRLPARAGVQPVGLLRGRATVGPELDVDKHSSVQRELWPEMATTPRDWMNDGLFWLPLRSSPRSSPTSTCATARPAQRPRAPPRRGLGLGRLAPRVRVWLPEVLAPLLRLRRALLATRRRPTRSRCPSAVVRIDGRWAACERGCPGSRCGDRREPGVSLAACEKRTFAPDRIVMGTRPPSRGVVDCMASASSTRSPHSGSRSPVAPGRAHD